MVGKRSAKGPPESASVSHGRKDSKEAGTTTTAKGKLRSCSLPLTKTVKSSLESKPTAGSKKPPLEKSCNADTERVNHGTRPMELRSGVPSPVKIDSIMARYGITSKGKPPTRSSAPAFTDIAKDVWSAGASDKPKPGASTPVDKVRAQVARRHTTPLCADSSGVSSRSLSACPAAEEMQPQRTRGKRCVLVGSAVSLVLAVLVLLGWMLLSTGANTKSITKEPMQLAKEGRRWSSRLLNATRRVTAADNHDDSVYDVWDFRRRAHGKARALLEMP